MNFFRRSSFRRQPFGGWVMLLIVYCLNANAGNKPKDNEVMLKLGRATVTAELANTQAARERGLMQRKQLASGSGMLFEFETPQPACLWMKNTPLPLSAAFINDAGQITRVIDLEPYSEQQLCETLPIRYILEVNRNWFRRNGVDPGTQVDGLPKTFSQ